jgi:hypothetical protein
MSDFEPMPDRRRASRSRVLLTGKLHAGEGTSAVSIDCVIRNRSDGGVLVELPSPLPLMAPLQIVKISEGLVYEAQIVWRRGRKLGLELGEPTSLSEIKDRKLAGVRAVWSQIALR